VGRRIDVGDGSAYDLATRIAAFEFLFGVRVSSERWHAALAAIGGAIEAQRRAPTIAPELATQDQARAEVSAAATAKRDHREAALAEIVVVGAPLRGVSPGIDAPITKALPLARGILLVRAEKFSEALVVFEEILDLVPGHTLALQQSARCCVECGAPSQAEMYSRRASGRAGRAPGDGRRNGAFRSSAGRGHDPRGGS